MNPQWAPAILAEDVVEFARVIGCWTVSFALLLTVLVPFEPPFDVYFVPLSGALLVVPALFTYLYLERWGRRVRTLLLAVPLFAVVSQVDVRSLAGSLAGTDVFLLYAVTIAWNLVLLGCAYMVAARLQLVLWPRESEDAAVV